MTTPDTQLPSPFLPLPNVLNIRHVPLPTASTYRIIRAGNIAHLTSSNAQEYDIRTIFDLRSKSDMKRFKTPLKVLEGVDVQWMPMIPEKGVDEKDKNADESPEDMYSQSRMRASFAAFQADSVAAFMKFYITLLQVGQESIGKVLRKIIERGHDAGKDRTGVLVALILLLAETASSTIIDDYALTTVGLKANWDMIMGEARNFIFFMIVMFLNDQAFVENPEGGLEMLSSHPGTMAAFLDTFHRTYSDTSISEPDDRALFRAAEKYVRDVVGLTPEEVQEVKMRLKGDSGCDI
ncbi:protein-tyrosine phosphatase-like protein [Hysterangium stoloniferum]|nr:protein-tyrosine phosphatase-like protein [Hysterangium stoloniferum]